MESQSQTHTIPSIIKPSYHIISAKWGAKKIVSNQNLEEEMWEVERQRESWESLGAGSEG
jgi:hypothetical protein